MSNAALLLEPRLVNGFAISLFGHPDLLSTIVRG
jgi:hypothetical protein